MAIVFKIQTQNQRDDQIALAIWAREKEYTAYHRTVQQISDLINEIELAGAPTLDQSLQSWVSRSRDEIIAGLPDADADAVLAFKNYRMLKQRLKSERHERDKVEKYHEKLVASISQARLDAALARVAAQLT